MTHHPLCRGWLAPSLQVQWTAASAILLWLFMAESRSLAPLADALRLSKQSGFLLLIQLLNNLKGDPLEIRYSIQCLKTPDTILLSLFIWDNGDIPNAA